MEGLGEETMARLGTGKKKGAVVAASDPITATIHFKRLVFDLSKKIVQS